MNWYYVEQGQQAGPVDDAQLEELRRSGRIQAETLIWREGMANWVPYSQAKGGAVPAAAALPAAAPFSAGSGDEPTEAVCTECGRIFSKADMIRYGTAHVCASCKPVFMQKLTEGAPLNTARLNYAGFWIRFGAIFLDGLILKAVSFVISLAFGMGLAQSVGVKTNPVMDRRFILIFLLQIAIAIGYEVFMIGKYGATLGKMACKIRVITADGGDVSYLRSLGRYFAKLLSSITCLIGYIMAGFDDEKRALHDHVCSTRVVYKEE